MDEPLTILRKLVELDDLFVNATDPNDMPLADEWTAEIEKARALLVRTDER